MAAPERTLGLPLGRSFRSDIDALAQHHRFIRTLEDDEQLSKTNPAELRLARRYYDRLFKEYAIADLSLAQRRRDEERQLARALAAAAAEPPGGPTSAAADADADSARRRLADLRASPPPSIGLRWRTRAEVLSGRGHLSCGNRACAERAALSTFELPFRWREVGEQETRAALVKVRLCARCALLLPRGPGSSSSSAAAGRRDRGRGPAGGGRGRREEEEEEEGGRAALRRRDRSRSPPPSAAAAPAAAAAAAAAANDEPAAPPGGRAGNEEADAWMDRLVQDMIDAFEAGAG